MNVGCRVLDVMDPAQGRVPAWVLYPARGPEREEQFGSYSLAVAMDAPVEGKNLPVAVISHGNNGTSWTHRGLAAHLARAGFVVALLEHPGNSRNDGSLAGTAANLTNRPRHVRLLIDAVAAIFGAAPTVAVIGHSIGGYTALAVAGGRPSCFPEESPDRQAHPVSVERDPRVRAVVLLAPATPWYLGEGALDGVDVPIFMRTGEHDAIVSHGDIVLRGVPDRARVDHRVVPNAGHFSFQSPFPPEMTRPQFPPSQDPPGFDRAAYQAVLGDEILAFLRGALKA
jgi:predicted dienelactone hydrolase